MSQLIYICECRMLRDFVYLLKIYNAKNVQDSNKFFI